MKSIRKIAVSGSSSIGKTTLACNLAMTIDCPLIADYMDLELRKKGFRSFKDIKSPQDAFIIRMNALLEKIEKEKSFESFVSDRSVLDYLAYWLLNSATYATNYMNFQFIRMVENHMRYYDLIILPLFGRIPLEKEYRRSNDIGYNFKLYSTIQKFLLYYNLPFIVVDQLNLGSCVNTFKQQKKMMGVI